MVRLQTVVSREVAPAEIAVVTVGSIQAGTENNLIPNHALLELNLRSYAEPARQRMLDVGPADRAGRKPSLRLAPGPGLRQLGSFPLTINDPATTDRPRLRSPPSSATAPVRSSRRRSARTSPTFPTRRGPLHVLVARVHRRKVYRAAEKAGKLQDLPSNHSPKFLPPMQPCLRTGTEALTTAALAWLARK